MTRIRRLQAALPLLAILLVSDCSSELATTPAATVTLRMATAWPATLDVPEVATVLTDVVDANGATISGVSLEWSSSDSSVLQVTRPDTGATPTDAERLSIGRRAIITAHGAGTATITARLDRPGLAPAQLRVPVVVQQRSWPALLTVGNEDTVGVGLAAAEPAVLGTLSFAWQSSDPAVLQATPVATDPSRAALTARANGPAQVTLTVTGDRLGRVEFREAFNVGSVQIVEQPQWPAVLPITEAAQLAVVVQDAAGNPAPGVRVTWSSTNLSAFTVDSNGVVTALSRGGGEVVASVGSPPFQIAEHRATLQVVEKWRTVSAGGDHTCAIATLDGTGYCWGSNAEGELGLGFDAAALPQASRPRRIATTHKFTELKAGEAHSCGREGSQNLLCWGSRDRGQLGDGVCAASGMGSTCFPSAESPVSIVSGGILGTEQIHLDQVVLGGTFSCIVDVNGGSGSFSSRKVRCWGTQDAFTHGISFAGTADLALVLTPGLTGNAKITEVTAGGAHLCAKTDEISWVQCMGINDHGQLGDGTVGNPPGPPWSPKDFTIVGGDPANPGGDGYPTSGLSAGGSHTCALDGAGVLCWGSNSSGQLGAAVQGDALYPTRAALPVQAVTLSAGDEHTCALVTGGDVWCWGSNSNGQLGRGTIGGSSSAPALVSGGLKFVSISAGGAHTCGVTPDGSIYCWGMNSSGQLGDATYVDRGAPVRVAESPQ
jgi:alpha-tubulin suppressor-like RCC1 family protein